MFGISDPWIWGVYLLALICVAWSVWFGIKYWNKDDKRDEE